MRIAHHGRDRPTGDTSRACECPRSTARRCRDRVERPISLRRPTARRRAGLLFPDRDGTATLRAPRLPCAGVATTTRAFAEAASWSRLTGRLEHEPHRPNERLPLRTFAGQLLSPFRRDAVIPRALAFLRALP